MDLVDVRRDLSGALFSRLREQPLRELLLIDDLPAHGINDLVFQQSGRVSHGHLLWDQAGPHTPLFRQSRLGSRYPCGSQPPLV